MYNKEAIRAGKVQIRRVFLEEWDPIGISDEPNAQDEYDLSLDAMYDLLLRNASEAEIVDYLHEIETDRMGMMSDKKRLSAIAKVLKSLDLSLPNAA